MNVLLLASHGIAEYDDVRMFARLGYDVFCPGGYSDPAHPGETLRPPIPEAPDHPELRALCDAKRAEYAGADAGHYIDWAKADLHPDLVDWADVIIVHHFVREWIGEQWPRIRHKRVIWRTCGQSDPGLERHMTRFRDDGLQIVRYSPAEERYFGNHGTFAGQDAMIRFGKYPDDYGPWTGDGDFQLHRDRRDVIDVDINEPFIGNVTQNMVERGNATGLDFYLAATEGLPARPAGPGSEQLPGGIGALDYGEMLQYLRRARAYIYTGTTPASYTLGLIEAMLSGVQVVSIGPAAWAGPDDLFEGHEITRFWSDDPNSSKELLRTLLKDKNHAAMVGYDHRLRAIDLFGMDTIGPQWQAFLGEPLKWLTTPYPLSDGRIVTVSARGVEPPRALMTSPWDATL